MRATRRFDASMHLLLAVVSLLGRVELVLIDLSGFCFKVDHRVSLVCPLSPTTSNFLKCRQEAKHWIVREGAIKDGPRHRGLLASGVGFHSQLPQPLSGKSPHTPFWKLSSKFMQEEGTMCAMLLAYGCMPTISAAKAKSEKAISH